MAVNTTDVQALIAETVARLLVTPLEEQSTFLSSGPRIIDSASPIRFPRLAGGFTPGFVAESALIPTQDGPTFDAVTAMPSTMQSLKLIVRLSRESLRESSQALDAILSDRLVRDVQTRLDAQAWGNGGDGIAQPKGVLHSTNTADMVKVDAAGPVTLDVLHDAYGAALGGDVPLSGLKWVLSPGMLTSLRKIKTATGSRQYVLSEDVSQGPAGLRLLGVPVTVTKKLAPSGTQANPKEFVLLWSPSSWAVVRDLSPAVELLRERFAEYDEIGLKIVTRWDWVCLQPEANVLVTNATPATA